MQRVSKGYTIVEVMIFLAISVALLIAAMNLISGKQNETEFNQKMRDTQSKIEDWLNDVSTGFTGGSPDQQHCVISGNRPQVVSGAPGAGYSPSCIFLGKAILFSTQSGQNDQLVVYPVFGCRLTGCNSTGSLPIKLSDTNPEPQAGQGGALDLTETFSLNPATISHVTANGPYTDSELVGFFSTLNNGSSQNGNSDVTLNEFNHNSGGGPPATNCLELIGPCSTPQLLTSYKVCLTDGRRYADIIITTSSGTGAQTALQYVDQASC